MQINFIINRIYKHESTETAFLIRRYLFGDFRSLQAAFGAHLET